MTQSSLLQVLDPLEMYRLTEVLEAKVETLEAEKIALLESKAVALEEQVREHTAHLQAQAEQNRLVADLAFQIRSSLSLSVILQTAVNRIQAILNCDRVTIWQFDADWASTVVAEATTSEVSLLGTQVQENCLESGTDQFTDAFLQGQIRIVPDIHTAEISECHRELLVRLHTRAKVLVPLLCDGELWGLLRASESQQARDWRPHEVELLQALAIHLAIAIHQATTHEQLAAELQLRCEAEARLRESEQRYATLTNAVPVAILRSDLAGNIIFFNERWSQLSGLPVDASLGKGWLTALHPEDRNWVMAKTQAYVLQGMAFQHEYRLLRPDGQVVWVYEQTEIERNTDGQIVGHIGTLTDISARKEAELALHQSEAKYSAVVNALPDLVIRMSREGVYLDFFATGKYNLLGNPQDYIGAHVADFFPPDLAQRRLQAAQAALDTHSVQVYEQTLVNEGQPQTEEVRIVPYSHDEVVLIIRDITQRYQAELALRELEQENQAILATMPDLIIVLDADGTFMRYDYNAELSEIAPIHPQPVGLSLKDLLPLQEADRFSLAVKHVLHTGQVEVFEQQLQFDDGLHYEEVRVVPYRTNQVLSLVRDVTHRKQAELAIEGLIEGTAATGSDFFPSLVIHITQALGVPYGAVSELREGELHVLAFAAHGDLHSTFSYDPFPTPCQLALQSGSFHCECSVQTRFPGDPDLVAINADSYLGIAITNTQGQAMGTLCILDTQPLQDARRAEQILRIFGARAGAELERQQAMDQLTTLNAELEHRVNERTATLQEREQFLTTVLDTFPLAVFWKDRQCVMQGCNRLFAEASGLAAPEEAIGRSNFEFGYPEAEAQAYTEDDQQVMQSGIAKLAYVESFVTPEGDQRWVETNRIPMRDLTGKVTGIVGTFQDITERKKAELALEQESLHRRTVFNASSDGIHILDIEGNLIEANTSFLESIGYTLEEAKHLNASDWDAQLTPAEIQAHLQSDVINDAGLLRIDTLHRHKDGRVFPVEISICAMDWHGQTSFVCAARDISERNQAEAQLRRTNAELIRATQMKDEFLANMSHEIRTPMNAVIGMTKLALRTNLNAQQRNYLSKIDTSASVLLHIIDDILDFSKIEAGRLTLEQVDFSLEEVLTHLADVTGFKADQKALEFLFDVAPETPLQLVGDPIRLGQILLNLVSNAIKFTSSGHVLLSVRCISAVPEATVLEFSVADTGIGLSQGQIANLFQAFSQGDASTTRKFGGTGLGLAISKRLVKLMNGDIGIDSTLGRGSTFWFTATFQAPPSSQISGIDRSLIPPELQDLRVLAVDDHAVARTLLQDTLESFRFHPTVVATPDQALAALEMAHRDHQPYPVVIVDYVMPEMDGIAFIQRLQSLDHYQTVSAILMVTSHPQLVVQEAARSAGIQQILSKPVRPSQLLEAIIEALHSQQSVARLPAIEATPASFSYRPLTDVRVLLVEDHEINQELATEFLTQAGAMVRVAEHGQEAFELVQKRPFDVVLMDCQMPVMDGYEATRLIRTLPDVGQIPIIAMTANAMEKDRQKCLEAGMNDYIAKPILQDYLYAVIVRWVESASAYSQPMTSLANSSDITSLASPTLPALSGLTYFDVELGLRYAGNNPRLYIKLLQQFLANKKIFSDQINHALQLNDYSEAIRLTHSLKGICGTLGCVELRQQAQYLEHSLRERADKFEAAALATLLTTLTRVLTQLDAWQKAQIHPTNAVYSHQNLDWLAVLNLIHVIDINLDADLNVAFEALVSLQDKLKDVSEVGEIVNALTSALDAFELDQVREILHTLAQFAKL